MCVPEASACVIIVIAVIAVVIVIIVVIVVIIIIKTKQASSERCIDKHGHADCDRHTCIMMTMPMANDHFLMMMKV